MAELFVNFSISILKLPFFFLIDLLRFWQVYEVFMDKDIIVLTEGEDNGFGTGCLKELLPF